MVNTRHASGNATRTGRTGMPSTWSASRRVKNYRNEQPGPRGFVADLGRTAHVNDTVLAIPLRGDQACALTLCPEEYSPTTTCPITRAHCADSVICRAMTR